VTALPLPGPLKDECACGCGTFGTVRRKTMNDGLQHVNRCPCVRCKSSRYKKNASARERRIANRVAGEREVLSGALSGVDGRAGLHVWEETSNVAITRGFESWINGKGVQSKIARLMGQRGVYRHLILSTGRGNRVKPAWVVTPYEDWAADLRPSDELTAEQE
jgi:hypothetical protein